MWGSAVHEVELEHDAVALEFRRQGREGARSTDAGNGGPIERVCSRVLGKYQLDHVPAAADRKLDRHLPAAAQLDALRHHRLPVALHGGQKLDKVGPEIDTL